VGSDADILVALSQDNGATWTEPAALNSNAASDTAADLAPYVTTDRQGRWVAIWSSLEASASAHTNILSAQSTDDGVTWTVPVTINPDSSGDRDFANHVTADGSGHWVVLLQSDDSVGDTVDFDLVASRGSEPLPTPTPTVSLPPAMTATPTRSSTPTVSPPTTPTATPTALPTRTPAAPPVLGKAVRACLTALAVQARTFAVTEHKLIQKCLDQLLTDTAAGKGTVRAIAACLKTLDRTRLDSALARAQASATGKIAKKCTGVLPNEIANPCDAEAPTLAATATCVLAMYAASVEEQIAASYADACTLIATVGIEDQLPRLCSQP
jgi:hypothetical protein